MRAVSEAALLIHLRLLLVRLCATRCVGAGGQPEEWSVTQEKCMNSVYRKDQMWDYTHDTWLKCANNKTRG